MFVYFIFLRESLNWTERKECSLFLEEKTHPDIYCNFELHVYENDLKKIKKDFVLLLQIQSINTSSF